MATVDPAAQTRFWNSCSTASEDIQEGLSVGRATAVNDHWKKLAYFFARVALDPLLFALQIPCTHPQHHGLGSYLTDYQLLAYLEMNFPQPLPWQLWTLPPKPASGIAAALRQKTSKRGCLLAEPPPSMTTGKSWPTSSQGWPSTPYFSLYKYPVPILNTMAWDYQTGNITPNSRGL